MSAKRNKPIALPDFEKDGNGLVLVPPIVGYAASKDQAARLIEAGYSPVFREGDGAETLTEALKYFRKRRATLAICTDGSVFGDKRKPVVDALKLIDAAGLTIHDIANPDDKLLSDHMERGLRWAAGFGRIRDRRTARQRGALGGKAKLAAMEARRDLVASRPVIERLCNHPKLTWRDCADILEMPVQTLKRCYGGI
jgi:hypothetical protein